MQLEFKIPKELRGESIVMVDDEVLDFEAVGRGLRKSAIDNDFLTFEDGPPFLDYLEEAVLTGKSLPALVLLDINMPLMSGFDVIKAIRQRDEFRGIPIISMLTSSTANADRRKARELGANDYLVKPNSYREYVELFDNLFED